MNVHINLINHVNALEVKYLQDVMMVVISYLSRLYMFSCVDSISVDVCMHEDIYHVYATMA